MSKYNSVDAFPFSRSHLIKFQQELEAVDGDFIKLMIVKEAITVIDGVEEVVIHDDIDAYRKKCLIGVYSSLRPLYETELPFTFWNALYEILLKTDLENK